MKDLNKDIKTGKFRTCYLFWGKENYLKKKYEDSIKKAFVQDGSEFMNYDIFEDKKIPASRIIDSLETLPFLAEKRLVLVKDSGLFHTGRKEDSEKLADYISKIPESSCLLFVEDEIDKRGKLYKSVVKYGFPLEFKTPDEKSLIRWVTDELNKEQIQIEGSTAAYFIRTIESNMEAISSELKKISAYIGKSGNVTKKEIDEICIPSFEAKIFDLVAAIGNKKPDIALEIYRNMILMKESPIMILTMITRQFRLIYQSKLLIQSENGTAEIAQRLGQREFIVRECIKQAKNFSAEKLKKAIEDCLKTDVNVKTGKMGGELAVELLILAYSK